MLEKQIGETKINGEAQKHLFSDSLRIVRVEPVTLRRVKRASALLQQQCHSEHSCSITCPKESMTPSQIVYFVCVFTVENLIRCKNLQKKLQRN